MSFSSNTSGTSEPIPASKIFYRSISNEECTAILQNSSMTTEEVRLPMDTMKEVVETLQNSTTRIPKSARTFREWEVGFLERYVEGRDT